MTGIATFLPVAARDDDAAPAGAVFKVERNARGEKVAYVRMFSGAVHVRERLHLGEDREGTVTALSVFEHGAAVGRPVVRSGQIARLSGLREVRVGDSFGDAPRENRRQSFADAGGGRHPRDPGSEAMHAALAAHRAGPAINLRQMR
jgi:ribosomal protection tetracycline resistance protein